MITRVDRLKEKLEHALLCQYGMEFKFKEGIRIDDVKLILEWIPLCSVVIEYFDTCNSRKLVMEIANYTPRLSEFIQRLNKRS